MAHAEMGTFSASNNDNALSIQRTNGNLVVQFHGASNLKWHPVESDVDYEVERITEEGSVKGNPKDQVKGRQSRAYLEIPPHAEALAIEVVTTVGEETFFRIQDGGKKARSAPEIFSPGPASP